MFLEQGTYTRRDDRMTELWHRWIQVMLNLEIKITHPPADKFERARGDVHRVDSGIAHPIHL